METSLYLFIYSLIVILVCIKILFDTNSSSKALAYIFLVIVFPVLGIIVYFAIGANYRKKKLYQKKLIRDHESFPELESQVASFSDDVLSSQKIQLTYFYPLANISNRNSLTSDNNNVSLLINGEKKFPSFIESIKAAKHHIHIEYYIYANDDIGTKIADLLIKKAKEGVQVRFIYDDFGSKSIRKKFIHRMKIAGIEVVPFYEISLIYLASRINYRNHRKILVVDGTIGYVGGINVSDKYLNQANNKLFWRDTHLKITGISVLNLQHIFLTDWNFCSGQSIPFSTDYFPLLKRTENYGSQLVQIVASGPDSEHPNIMYNLMQAILLSRKEILITTPYFIPEKSFLDALKIARLSGVTIKIIVPYKSDSVFVNAASNSYYQNLIEIGIEIYRYKKGFVHSKTMICDSFVSTVGTANLDNRSFDLNFEVNAIVYDKKLAEELISNFENDLKYSELINLEQWKNRSFLEKLFEKIMHLFAPLL